MHYEGKIYRPWMESESVLIQATIGCTINTCTFCCMFRDKKFRTRKVDDVLADIEEARLMCPSVKSVFLIDGNVMAVNTKFQVQILDKIKETFPEIEQISMYAGFNDLRRKTDEDLKSIKEAGLDMVYVGLESGDPVVLERIHKRMTAEQGIEGMAKAKKAGIDVLASFVLGLGGKFRSQEHIEETVRLLNIMEPEQIAPMALTIQPGTELEQEVESGEFVQATPLQILEEEVYLLENLKDFKTYYWGDHGNNIAPMRGWFPTHREAFLNNIKKARNEHPEMKEEVLTTFAW